MRSELLMTKILINVKPTMPIAVHKEERILKYS